MKILNKNIISLILLFLPLFMPVVIAQDVGTEVGGVYYENVTWSIENSPYIITNTVQIPNNVTLTIEAGVTIQSAMIEGNMFLIHGKIIANGEKDSMIVFDGAEKCDIFNVEQSTSDCFLDLDYCIIKDGYHLWWGGNGNFNLTHSHVFNMTNYSYIWYPENDVYIEYNSFTNCGGFSIGDGTGDVFIRYNLFIGKNILAKPYADYLIENWNSNGDPMTVVKYNSFINMDGIVLRLPPSYPDTKIFASENYWGTTNTTLIDSMIYDLKDDILCADYIDYSPILTEPHPYTPELSDVVYIPEFTTNLFILTFIVTVSLSLAFLQKLTKENRERKTRVVD